MSHMHDPQRWLETDELPPELRRELSAYGSDAPTVERRMRMLDNLEQQLGLAEGTTAPLESAVVRPALGGATGAGVGAVAGTLVKLKLVLGLLATAGAALGAWSMWSSAQSSPARPVVAAVHGDLPPSPATFRAVKPEVTRWAPVAQVEPRAAVHTPTHEREVAIAAAPVARRERKSSPAAQPQPPLDVPGPDALLTDDRSMGATSGPLSELTLLGRARRSLLSSPARSLELTEQHAREFPTGTLCEEREVLAIESLLKLGRLDRAKQRALAFERSFPGSAHRAHLARLITRPAP